MSKHYVFKNVVMKGKTSEQNYKTHQEEEVVSEDGDNVFNDT